MWRCARILPSELCHCQGQRILNPIRLLFWKQFFFFSFFIYFARMPETFSTSSALNPRLIYNVESVCVNPSSPINFLLTIWNCFDPLQILSPNFKRKCMDSSWENLYVDIGAQRVNLLATNFASVTADPKPAITQWHVEDVCLIVGWKCNWSASHENVVLSAGFLSQFTTKKSCDVQSAGRQSGWNKKIVAWLGCVWQGPANTKTFPAI